MSPRSLRLALLAPVGLAVSCFLTPPAGASGGTPTCDGHVATIVGTTQADTLTGTDGPDVIVGRAGFDTIDGGGGDDIICGDGGRDSIHGGAGDDMIFGGGSVDHLWGDAGSDLVKGGLHGGNVFYNTDGDGNDTYVLRDPTPYRRHDYGLDRLDYTSAGTGVSVDLGAGTSSSTATGADTLVIKRPDLGVEVYGTTFADDLVGGPGPDTLDGWTGAADTISGAGGDDHLESAATSGDVSHLSGGSGDDLVEALGRSEVVATGGPGNDRVFLEGQSWGTATGGDGDDHVYEQVFADTGPITVDGGDGRDLLIVSVVSRPDGAPYGTFTVDLGAGLISAGSGDSQPFTGFEGATVGGDDVGVDRFVERGTDGPDLLDVVEDGTTPAELIGLGGDDQLVGSNGDDVLRGGPGHDLGRGGDGQDTCYSVEGPLTANTPTCELTGS